MTPSATSDHPANMRHLAEWQARMSDTALWPDLDPGNYRSAIARVTDVTRSLVNGRTAVLDATDAGAVRELGRAAFRLGVGPLIGWWIESGRVQAAPPVAALFAEHLAQSRARRALLEREAAGVIGALRGAGIEPILLKGFDTASLHEHPAARASQDIDLLVRPEQAVAAEAVLAGLGLSLVSAVPQRRTFAPRGPRVVASLEMTHADTYWSVDLHTSLARTIYRAIPAAVPMPARDAGAHLTIRSMPVRVLPPTDRLVFLAVHASEALRVLQLVQLLDVVVAARAFRSARGDWSALAASVRAWKGERFVLPAFVLAERLAPGAFDTDFLAALQQHVHRRLLRPLVHRDLAEAACASNWRIEDALMWADSPVEVARILWRQAFPGLGLDWRDGLRFYARRVRRLVRGEVRLRGPAAPV